MNKHTTWKYATCALCRRIRETTRDLTDAELSRLHNKAIMQRLRNQAMRDLGLTRRKDGGWE